MMKLPKKLRSGSGSGSSPYAATRRNNRSRVFSSEVDMENPVEIDMKHTLHDFEEKKFDTSVGWLSFISGEQQKNYNEYRRLHFSPITFFMFMVLAVFVFLSTVIASINSSYGPFAIFNSLFFLVFTVIPGILILSVRMKEHIPMESRHPIIAYISPHASTLESILIFSNSLFWGMLLLNTSVFLKCNDFGSYITQNFQPSDSQHAEYPTDITITLIISTSVLQTILKGIHQWAILFSWIFSIIFIIITGSLTATSQTPLTVFCSFVFGYVLFDYEKQHLKNYLISVQRENIFASKLKADREKRMAATQAKELKDIIANVAHDIKTPLQAFVLGLESLQQLMIDISQIQSTEPGEIQMHATVGKETLLNLCSTSTFMSMTINRSIDFTKSSNGMALFPSYESTDIWACLEWPVQCMRSMQSRIPIDLVPLPPGILSYIITDKMWLQENLLCLISNAVKYSEIGRVTVTTSLETVLVNVNDNNLSASNLSKEKSNESNHNNNNEKKDELNDFMNIDISMSHDNEFDNNNNNINNINKTISNDSKNEKNKINNIVSTNQNQNMNPQKAIRMIRFEVEDYGVGISDAKRDILFDSFEQTQRRTGGTGLGLYSLARRVEALGGSYGLSDRRDGQQGTLIWFSFPYKPDIAMSKKHPRGLLGTVSDSKEDLSQIDLFDGKEAEERELPYHIRSAARILQSKPSTERMTYDQRNNSSTKLIARSSLNTESMLNVSAMNKSASSTRNSNSSISSGLVNRKNSILKVNNMSVLVVDDALPILKMTINALVRDGHRVESAENGAVALNMMKGTFVRVCTYLYCHR